MSARPPAPSLSGYRDGTHFVPRPFSEHAERVIAGGLSWRHPCRYGAGPGKPACGAPSVLQINRGKHVDGRGRVDSWWSYCEEHTYGSWIEDGRVWHWSLEDVPGATR